MTHTKLQLSKIIVIIAILTVFTSCDVGKEDIAQDYFGFEQSELIVEVDKDVKSFRIVTIKQTVIGEIGKNSGYTRSGTLTDIPLIGLETDTTRTTAKNNIHFINTGSKGNIGDFTILDEIKSYKDVEIIPENITKEVVIYYYADGLGNRLDHDNKNGVLTIATEPPANLIRELKVILRPKSK